ncbi:LysR family transcriptional regulator [Larsenimonas rhizosphaerae]|uniref:LysR family transcriptional regulator n=1 Tax=Larsenimonas rhizosphaerae TaxID=2944682 RepID=A0AA41ZN79_9GAMM|nr:LysR family transcriptional regulator [Larsenimonas rhizosphaerae]MCM2131270.1 LysR family transcriptional regulator [Larsenimonas rhizosphaerae]MCX2525371.1 LysR family transcriptional regulator [Larsenimonas rhizosphaerae]
MNYELQQIKAFLKVVELESFQGAAEALNLSQPALSRRIKKLESILGTALLSRTTRSVSLTTVGRDFFPQAKRLVDEFDHALFNIRALAENRIGQITLACIPTAAFYFLPAVIREYNARYPNIRIRLLDLSANDGLEAVLSGEAEFGINMLSGHHPDILFTPLVVEPFVLVCRRDHPLANKDQVTWTELIQHKLIGVGKMSGNRMLLDHELSELANRPTWFYEVQHLSTSLGMVEVGLGVAAVPRLSMPDDEHPVLVQRPLVEPLVKRTLGMVRRRDSALSPAAERFVETLLRHWDKGSDDDTTAQVSTMD